MLDIPIRVKDALKSGTYRKNYRVIVLDEYGNEIETLDNNRLISESVKLDERMCSGKTLQFGLCEGSSLEFQYFDYENINGKRVKLMLDVEYLDENGESSWYEIPMGYFDVNSCPMQFSTGIRKATCYNRLKSAYLDNKANDLIKNMSQEQYGSNNLTLYNIINTLLNDYSIVPVKKSGTPQSGDMIEPQPVSVNTNVVIGGVTYSKLRMEPAIAQQRMFVIESSKHVYFDIESYAARLKKSYAEMKAAIYEICENANEVWESVSNNLNWGITVFWSGGSYTYTIDGANNTIPLSNLHTVYNSTRVIVRCPLSLCGENDGILSPYIWKLENPTEYAYEISYVDLDSVESISFNKNNMPDVTLRNLISAQYELACQFGKLDRKTDLFSGITLNNNRLIPSDSLYPDNELLPISTAEMTNASSYEKLWTDSAGVQSFRYLIINYKNANGDAVLQRTVNEHGTIDYNMSSNWLFKNLVWTERQVAEYADLIVELMRDVSWFPFEMWSAGLPYMETGDELEITNSEGTYTSYILQRQLNGIQMLKDTYINGELDIF